MLCVTGSEADPQAALRRIHAMPDMLHEVRLDCFAAGSDPARAFRGHERHVILTLRSVAHGGGFRGSRADYEHHLHRILEAYAGWVDVEWEDDDVARRLVRRASHRIVLSWHGALAERGDLTAIARGMASLEAGVRKVAVPISDAADLAYLLDLAPVFPSPFVAVGLGEAGRASRVLHELFGSAWTFVSVDEAVPGAPGQLSLREARMMIPPVRPVPVAIVGGEQVCRSPGLTVYNRVFRKRGLPYSYVAWPTERLEDSLQVLTRLGIRGASVTMPHKQSAAAACQRLDPLAARVGAVNTIVREGDGWVGYNTDVGAVHDAVQAAGGARGQVAGVLGTGGAARAAVVALDTLGMSVHVFGRNLDAAGALCALGADVLPCAWTQLGADRLDVLVNATPVGSDAASSPVPAALDLSGCIVMDMIHTPQVTPLIRKAARSGATVVRGRDMWLLQAVTQMKLILGIELEPAELQAAWPATADPGDSA
jgi:3-dehydroquinate dehydratase/shikimate dehydrogenase